MIAIIDYGMGNLRSVEKAFEKVGFGAFVTDKSDIIEKADKVVLPGVGSFKDAIDGLNERNLVGPIIEHINKGKLFLGICLGLQLLFTKSVEGGEHKGLNVISGKVIKFGPLENKNSDKLKIPHMGWNTIQIKKEVSILKGLPDNTFMYFVHSYYVVPDSDDVVATKTEYGNPFVSMISLDNIFATQFHPEKSQHSGLTVLENFGKL